MCSAASQDLEACVWLENYLSTYNKCLVVISHSQVRRGANTGQPGDESTSQQRWLAMFFAVYVAGRARLVSARVAAGGLTA
jgi:hypothetical protein